MLRTFCLSKRAPRPEGPRSIFRRLEHGLEQQPRAIRRPLPGSAVRPAHA